MGRGNDLCYFEFWFGVVAIVEIDAFSIGKLFTNDLNWMVGFSYGETP